MNAMTNQTISQLLTQYFKEGSYSPKRKALLRQIAGSKGEIKAELEHAEKSYTSPIAEFRGGLTLDCQLADNPDVKLRILTNRKWNSRLLELNTNRNLSAEIIIVRWLNSYDRFLATVVDSHIDIGPQSPGADALNPHTPEHQDSPPNASSETSVDPDDATQNPSPTDVKAGDVAEGVSQKQPQNETKPNPKKASADQPSTESISDDQGLVLSREDFDREVAEQSGNELKEVSKVTSLIWNLMFNTLALGEGSKSRRIPGIGQVTLKKDGAIAELEITRERESPDPTIRGYSEVKELAPRKRSDIEKRALRLSVDLNDALGIAAGDAFSIAAATLRVANDCLGNDIGIELPERKILQRKLVGHTVQYVVKGAQSFLETIADKLVNILGRPSVEEENA